MYRWFHYRRTTIVCAAVLGLCLHGAPGYSQGGSSTLGDPRMQLTQKLWVGEQAPEIAITQVLARPSGAPGTQQISLASLSGTPVLLQLWAAWAPPCRPAMEAFNALQATYAPKGIAALSIAHDPLQDVQRFLRDVNVGHFVGWDRDGQTFQAYGIRYLPALLVIDPEGFVLWQGDTRDISDFEERVILQPLAGVTPQPTESLADVQAEVWSSGSTSLVEVVRTDDSLEVRWLHSGVDHLKPGEPLVRGAVSDGRLTGTLTMRMPGYGEVKDEVREYPCTAEGVSPGADVLTLNYEMEHGTSTGKLYSLKTPQLAGRAIVEQLCSLPWDRPSIRYRTTDLEQIELWGRRGIRYKVGPEQLERLRAARVPEHLVRILAINAAP